MRRKVVLFDNDRRLRAGVREGVLGLVVRYILRYRYENRRQSTTGYLEDGARTRTGDDNGGDTRRHAQRECVEQSEYLVPFGIRRAFEHHRGDITDVGEIGGAGLVHDVELRYERGQRVEHSLVDGLRSLRASHDKYGRHRHVELQEFMPTLFGGVDNFLADRMADECDTVADLLRKFGGCRWMCDGNPACEFGRPE